MDEEKIKKQGLSNIELEALLLQQEHRIFQVLRNFIVNRKQYDKDDPRRAACKTALIYALIFKMLPRTAMGAVGVATIVALVLSYYSLETIKKQNINDSRSHIFFHSVEIQKIFIDHPEIYPYLYEGKEIDSTTSEVEKRRVLMACEMLLDLLDHYSRSEMGNYDEGWKEFGEDLYANSPSFKAFYKEREQWYPNIGDFIKNGSGN